MKHISRIAIVSSIAVLALASCQKNEFVPEYTTTEGLTFTSVKPALEDETKTAWTGTTIQWSMGDAIRVAYTCDGVWQNADGTATAEEVSGSKTARVYQSNSLSADAETAQFTVPGNFKGTAEGTYVFYGAYPASACTDGTGFSFAPSLTVTIPSAQTPAADSFDSAADFMLGTSVNTYTGIPTEAVSMSWDRMVAHAQLTFKTLKGFTAGETISKVELTADSEADMVGKHYIYLDTKNVTKPNSTVTNALTINGTNLSVDETGTFVAWASFLPCTVKSLKVVVTTNKATYTREITSCELVFKKNARNVLAINMSSAIREDFGVASLPFEETFDAITTGNSTSTSGSGTSVTDDQMANFSNYATATYQAGGAVRIGKSGSLETKNLDLSKNFYVVVTAKGWSSSEVNLTISAGEQSKTVTLETYIGGEYKDYTIYFNAVSSSSTVKFTTNSSTRCFIDNIRIEEGSDPREPLTTPSVSASANGTTPNSIDVTWDAVKNAGSYVVTATPATGSAVSKTVTAVESTETYKYTIAGLAYETVYTISVVAKPSDTSLYLDSKSGVAEETVKTGVKPTTSTPTDVTFDFTKISDFSSWDTAYASHTVTYDEGVVTFASANKNTSTITDQPVSKGGDLTLVMNNSQTINSLEFTCTQWTTKKQTITLNTSTDGGDTWTKTTNTSSNFVLTVGSLPEGVNAIKFTFSSTKNQIGYKSLKINYNKI